jgi:lipase chaperone LimK
MEKALVGIEVTEKSVKLEGQDLVGAVSAHHVGKIGSLKVSFEGRFEFLPLANKAIDKLEELVPGDQKAIAQILKSTLASIKITL